MKCDKCNKDIPDKKEFLLEMGVISEEQTEFNVHLCEDCGEEAKEKINEWLEE